MRPTAFVGVAGFLLASHAIAAEPAAYKATVVDAEVLLRAGASDTFPDTGKLTRGSSVVVEREDGNGWLAVTAPHGSVSWIAFSFVEDLTPDRPTPKNGVVHAEGDVTIAPGKAGHAQPLDVRREKLPQGTTVLLIGPPVEFAGKKWWPIAPPPGDVRWIPKSAVQFDKAVNNNFTVRVTDTGGTPPAASFPTPSSSASPLATIPGAGGTVPAGGVTSGKPAVNHPLWAQAEAAEREGRLADAEKAYFELAGLMNAPGGEHEVATLCYTRVHLMREKQRGPGPNASKPLAVQSLPKEDRGVRPGTPTALPPATATSTGSGNTNTSANDSRGQWHGPGILRRSVVTPDGPGRQAYALEQSPGSTKAFVLAGQGVDLEKYVGKRVEVFGTTQRSGLTKPLVVATNVEPAQ